jgi:hypothetical protein
MNIPKDWVEIIDRKRYSTSTAKELASDAYWDGHNWERKGRNAFLMVTPKGNYFMVRMTQWQGERDTMEALSRDEAMGAYESLPEHAVTWEEAFPGTPLEDA